MILTVFQSDKGDCALLTSKDGKNMLIDGGMSDSYSTHVAPALGKIAKNRDVLDLVYVSHIDQDHIAGVLKMADDALKWKVFDFQRSQGNDSMDEPAVPRPPEVKAIWHNAFFEMLGKNSGPVEEQLAASAALLSSMQDLRFREFAAFCGGLATSMGEAVRLSRRIGAKQLNIPLNPEFDGKLMMLKDAAPIATLGSMSITIIGPSKTDLKNLRDEWNEWLKSVKGAKQVEGIRKRSEKDEELLGAGEVGLQLATLYAEADALAAALAARLGNRDKVTTPNLASLMLLVEENGKTLLLTGDGAWQDILAGLEATGKLAPGGELFVDVLKVQHHGSENNWAHEFGRRIIARDYIFCGNGAHENPDVRVVQAVLDSRIGSANFKSKHLKVDRPFKLWFNSSSQVEGKDKDKAHMKKIEDLVKKAAIQHPNKVKFDFIKESSQKIKV
jgi:beta-lactamase superfamily II metal-dependent hydrolase